MNDTQRLDFMLDNYAEVYWNPFDGWVCMVADRLLGQGGTAREAIDDAAAKIQTSSGGARSGNVAGG